MAQIVKLKRTSVAGRIPTTSNIEVGELAFNSNDKSLFIRGDSNAIVAIHDESTLHIDTTDKHVGIGTTSPAEPLHILASDPKIRLQDSDGTNQFATIFQNGGNLVLQARNNTNNGFISFKGHNGTTATEFARFNMSGSLGIGTTTPPHTLSVKGTISRLNTSGIQVINLQTSSDAGQIAINNSGGTQRVLLNSAGNSGFTGGNLGIGTFSPAHKLDVVGDIRLSGDLTYGAATNFDIKLPYESQNITFHTTATGGSTAEKMRIRHDGRVGIGTQSPDTKLDVTTTGANGIILNSDTGNASVSGRLFFKDSTSTSALLNVGGDFEIRTGATVDSSSGTRRLVVKPTGAIRFNDAYSFPTSDGSANQVLQTDGSGNLSFATVQAGGGGTVSEAFKNIAVSGQSTVVADGATDTLTLAAGTGMTITTNASSDTITFSSGTSFEDSDGDTKIQVEESSDEDIIRFDVAGNEFATFAQTSNEHFIRLFRRGTSATGKFSFDGSGLKTDVDAGYNSLMIHNNGTEQARFDSAGRVGIGTTSPSFKVDIYEASSNGLRIKAGDQISDVALSVGSAGTADKFVIQSGGNVGIGITAPTYPLVVQSDSTAAAVNIIGRSSDSISQLDFDESDGTFLSGFQSRTTDFRIRTVQNLPLLFMTNNTERMRVDTGGRLLIGTTSTTPGFSTTNGHAFHVGDASHISRDSGVPLVVNRGTNDGSVLQIRKSGSFVGGLGTAASSTYLEGDSNGGIYINGQTDVRPWNTSSLANLDNSMSLGSTSARFKDLHLSGSANIGTNILMSNATTSAFMQVSSNILQFGTSSNDPLAFFTNNTEAGRFDTSGNLSIGTNSFDSGNITSSGTINMNTDSATLFLGADIDMRILHDGSNGTIRNDTGNLTLDVAGDINLDAGGANINFNDDGTAVGHIEMAGSNLEIKSKVADKDIIFKGNDNGSTITALQLDMSQAGRATFNEGIVLSSSSAGDFGVNINTLSGDSMKLQVVDTGTAGAADGSITVSDGDLTLDVSGNLVLDADGGTIDLMDGGTRFGRLQQMIGGLGISAGSTPTFQQLLSETKTLFFGHIELGDNKHVRLGNSNGDLQLIHDGSNSFIEAYGTGNLIIKQSTDDADIVFQSDDGSGGTTTYFFLDGSQANTNFQKDIIFADNKKALFGGSGDLQLYHSGSHSYIENNTGDLVLLNNADDKDIILKSDDGSGGTTAYLTLDGAGGRMVANKSLRIADTFGLQLGDSSDFQASFNGNHTFIANNTGILYLTQNVDDGVIHIRNDDGSGGVANYITLHGGTGEVRLSHYGNVKLKTQSDGIDVTGHIDATTLTTTGNVTVGGNLTVNGTTTTLNTATLDVEDKNITLNKGSGDTSGSADGAGITIQDAVNASTDASITWRASDDKFITSHPVRAFGGFELPDNNKLIAGDSSDLQFYHDGSNSYIQHGNTGNFNITTAAGTEFALVAQNNGSVFLYHDGTAKFQTTSGGASVTGALAVSGNISSGIYEIGDDVTSTSSTTQTTISQFSASSVRSCRFTVQVTNNTDSTYHTSELLLVHDGTTPGITEFGTIFTGAAAEATFDADISSGSVRLRATPASADSMTFKVVRHMITT